MPLCRHSVGTYQETSSHTFHQGTVAEQLWTDPGSRSVISMCDLISTLKKKFKSTGRE